MSEKPNKPKPQFYAYCFEGLQEIAKKHGYALLLHGSMNRDFDLVAVPWVDDAKDHFTVLKEFMNHLGARFLLAMGDDLKIDHFYPKRMGGDRISYTINLNRGEKSEDEYADQEYYIDICFTPSVPA